MSSQSGWSALSFRQIIALALPPALIVSMSWLFKRLAEALGEQRGYLAGFAIYWTVWCGAIPLMLLGRKRIRVLFVAARPTQGKWYGRPGILLALPLVFPLIFRFLPNVGKANAAVLLVSLVLGIVIAVSEEILWRGVYLALFSESTLLGMIYPSFGFAAWHIAPLAIRENPNPGGMMSFVAYAFVLGLFYAFVAHDLRSLRAVTLSHAVHDALGLGGFAYAAWWT